MADKTGDAFLDAILDLEETDGLATAGTKPTKAEFARTKFECESCGGTGRWSGGTNRHGNAKCNTCHGQGFLVTSPEQRRKDRAASARRKAKKFDDAQAANMAHGNGALVQFLRDNASWSDMCRSMLQQHAEGRELSDKQVEAARRMWVKVEEKRRTRKLERELAMEAAPTADATRIREMFDAALAAGKKRRALHAGNFDEAGELLNKVVLTPARAPRDEIWVKVDGDFMGGIKGDGKLDLRNHAPAWLADRLLEMAADPDGVCRLYGQCTGTCSCCGRELTNALSINLGIGPICREKWGLA